MHHDPTASLYPTSYRCPPAIGTLWRLAWDQLAIIAASLQLTTCRDKCSPHLSLSVTKTMPNTVQMSTSKALKMSDTDKIKVSWRQSHVRSRDCFIFRKSWALWTSKHCHPRPTVTTKQIVSYAMHRMKIHPRFPLRRGQDSLQAHLCLSMGCFWADLVNLLISKRWPRMIPFQSALAWD